MASTTTQTVSARVPIEHADKIAGVARAKGDTVSGTVARLIAEHLNQQRLTSDETRAQSHSFE